MNAQVIMFGGDDTALNEGNFIRYAMKHYDNPQCMSVEEFMEDLNRIKYVKRLLNRYRSTGNLKERLILNHIVVFYNVFGIAAATKILFYKLEDELHDLLKTFLTFLNYMPDRIDGARIYPILNTNLAIDFGVAQRLRNL